MGDHLKAVAIAVSRAAVEHRKGEAGAASRVVVEYLKGVATAVSRVMAEHLRLVAMAVSQGADRTAAAAREPSATESPVAHLAGIQSTSATRPSTSPTI